SYRTILAHAVNDEHFYRPGAGYQPVASWSQSGGNVGSHSRDTQYDSLLWDDHRHERIGARFLSPIRQTRDGINRRVHHADRHKYRWPAVDAAPGGTILTD